MCAAFEIHGVVFRPGKLVCVTGNQGTMSVPWAGFARNEIRTWWLRKGLIEVDVPASRFAERSNRDGTLRWESVSDGRVLRGLCEERNRQWILRVLTRAALVEEVAYFQHERAPVIEPPLFRISISPRELPRENGMLPGF